MDTKNKVIIILIISFFSNYSEAQVFSLSNNKDYLIFRYENKSLGVADDEILGDLPFVVYLPYCQFYKYEKGSWGYTGFGHYFFYEDSQLIFIEDNEFHADTLFSSYVDSYNFKGYTMKKNRLKPNIYFKYQTFDDICDLYSDFFNDIHDDSLWIDYKPQEDRYSAYFVKDNMMVYFYNIKKENFFSWYELLSNSFYVIPYEESVFKKNDNRE